MSERNASGIERCGTPAPPSDEQSHNFCPKRVQLSKEQGTEMIMTEISVNVNFSGKTHSPVLELTHMSTDRIIYKQN
jgi:hypothetical protein